MNTKSISRIAITKRAKPRVRNLASVICFGLLFAVLIASAFYTASSASSGTKLSDARLSNPVTTSEHRQAVAGADAKHFKTKWFSPLLLPAPPSPDSIATYEVVMGACTNTLKDSFSLGDQVCVRASAPPFSSLLSISGTDGTVASLVDVTTDPQEVIFTLPMFTTSVVNGAVVDNRDGRG